jgi:hypothetical protein
VSLFLVWCVGSHDVSSHTLRVVRHLPTEICTYSVIITTVWWWSMHIISCSCLSVHDFRGLLLYGMSYHPLTCDII